MYIQKQKISAIQTKNRKEEKKMDEDLALTTEQLEELSNNKAEKVEE